MFANILEANRKEHEVGTLQSVARAAERLSNFLRDAELSIIMDGVWIALSEGLVSLASDLLVVPELPVG